LQQQPSQPRAGSPAIAPIDPARAHRRALDQGDEVVQQLAVAKYALSIGDTVRAMAAIDAALGTSRRTLTDLLNLLGPPDNPSFAGVLVRRTPAQRQPPAEPYEDGA
jgi:hypothetical protein